MWSFSTLSQTKNRSVEITFESEPELKALFVVHMPLTTSGLHTTNATELPINEVSPGHYIGYWTIPSNAYAEGARVEVKVQDAFGNKTNELTKGKLFINN